MVNLYGGSGFIGSHYAKSYECIVNERNDLVPKSESVLYMISTTDNYNVLTNPYIDIDTNLTTLIRVLENCKTHKLVFNKDITFNFISSWFVYGDTNLPAREDSYCDPKGFYSITKRAAEQLLISYCKTNNINYRILRLANVAGPGDLKTSKKKNALTHLIREIKKGNDVNLYDNGEFIRDYIHVKDLCKAINLVLEKGELNSIYNIGNSVPINFKEAISYVIMKTKSASKINAIEQAEFHKLVQVKSMYMDCSKLKELGYTPEYDMFKILDDLIENDK